MTPAPLSLLEAVARFVNGQGIRAATLRAPLSWRDQTSPGRYAVVSHVAPWAAALRGDDRPIRSTTRVQISVWETPDQASAGTDAGVISGLVDALEGGTLDLGIVGRNVEPLVIPDPDTDDVQTAITVTYLAGA